MTSTKAFLFLALQARIAAIVVDGQKVFRYINHDLGFLDEDVPNISLPAVLIDMNGFKYSDLSENAQIGEGTISLKVIFAPYSETSNLTPDKWKQKGLAYYEIEEELHRALQGWKPSYVVEVTPANPDADPPTPAVTQDLLNYFQQLTRSADRTDPRRKDLRVRVVTYSTAFEDYGTTPGINYIPAPDPVIDIDESIIIDETGAESEDL